MRRRASLPYAASIVAHKEKKKEKKAVWCYCSPVLKTCMVVCQSSTKGLYGAMAVQPIALGPELHSTGPLHPPQRRHSSPPLSPDRRPRSGPARSMRITLRDSTKCTERILFHDTTRIL
eukprot:3647718-Rhodomonas_salina.1